MTQNRSNYTRQGLSYIKQQQFKLVTFYIASQNTDKTQAVKIAVDYFYKSFNTSLVNVENIISNVPNQPFDNQVFDNQVYEGALNRYKSLIDNCDKNYECIDDSIFIAIENGIICCNYNYYDIGCVCVGYKSKTSNNYTNPVVKYTRKVQVPEALVRRSLLSNQKITVGSLFEQQYNDISKLNWFTNFGYDRATLLSDAILDAFCELPIISHE